MHIRKAYSVLSILLLAILVQPALAEDELRYDLLLENPATYNTMRSLCMAVLLISEEAEAEAVERGFQSIWWGNDPAVEMTDDERDISRLTLARYLDELKESTDNFRLDRVQVAGFSQIGTANMIDFYLAAENRRGPIFFRFSIYFPPDGSALLYEIKVFEGFKASREAVAQMQYVAGARVVGMDRVAAESGPDQE